MPKSFNYKTLLPKVIFVTLIIFVFTFSVALAEFARQTGGTGWGYGYGYGYGLGYGWDEGADAGRRIGGEEALSSYGYGYGRGYIPENSSYDEETDAYTVDVDDLSSLVISGVISIQGDSPEEATSVIFNNKVMIEYTDANENTIQIRIPEGTVITNSEDGETFDSTALISGDVFADIVAGNIGENADVQGAIEFGYSGANVYFSRPVEIIIPVDESLIGSMLSIVRSPDDGETWTTDGLTNSDEDTCSDVDGEWVGSNPVTETMVDEDGNVTIYTCRASYFASYSESEGENLSSSGSAGFGVFEAEKTITQPTTPATIEDPAVLRTILDSKPVAEFKPQRAAITDLVKEQDAIKSFVQLTKKLPVGDNWTVIHYVAYGTSESTKLSQRERQGLITNYFEVYGHLPVSAEDWKTIAEITVGLKPTQVLTAAEQKSVSDFIKTYKRVPDLNDAADQSAINFITYRILQVKRDLTVEKEALGIFTKIYRLLPSTGRYWAILRAIAYSGVK